VMFDALSRQHAWHAELWEERIPIIEGVVDPAEVSGAPTPGAAELFDTLGSHSGGGGTLGRLVGLARVVYPRLVCGYAHHLRRVSEASDAPIVRALRLVLRDESEAWQAAEYLVQGLIRRPHDVEVVTAHQQHLEEFVVGTGPGLVAWPQDPQH